MHRMRGRMIVALLIALAGIVLLKLYLGSHLFSLKQARIIGELSPERREQIAEKIKLYKGRNLISLDLAELARDMRESFPWIKNLSMTKRLPDVLEIELLTWEPVAVIDIGKQYCVDSSGSRVSPCTATDAEGLPRIYGLDHDGPGMKLRLEQVRFALDLIKRVQDAGVQPLSAAFSGDSIVRVELRCGSTLEFAVENALDSIDWLVGEWGSGEEGLCRYGWVYVVKPGKMIVKERYRCRGRS